MKEKKCPITGKQMRHIFDHLVLGKYPVSYFVSDEGGIIQTEDPYWLSEAYSSVISDLDTWIAERNFFNARWLESALALLFPRDSVFVDVACGYGILTRLMRDRGFNFYGEDKFCANIFSRPFNPPSGMPATAVFAFEVLEHVQDPIAFISEQLDRFRSDFMFVSTTVFEEKIPDPSWPYYSFESGQHITLYQPIGLKLVAQRLGCRYLRLREDVHLFAKRSLPAWKLTLLSHQRCHKAYSLMRRALAPKRSFTYSDYEMLREKVLSAHSAQ